jgi:hypothetical protein
MVPRKDPAPKKTITAIPLDKVDVCPFPINVYYCATDGHHYLSSKGSVRNFLDGVHCSHVHHEKLSVLLSSQNDMDQHVVKMVKKNEICNSSPTTSVRMLHAMGDRLYDHQVVSNIFIKVNAALLEEMGVDTTTTKAQQLVIYILHTPIVNGVILLHDPNSNTIGTHGKGRPTMVRENVLVMLVKMANEEIRVEEVDRNYVLSAEDCAEARRGALDLPDSDAMLLYCAWCTYEELHMATMFGFLFTCDTTCSDDEYIRQTPNDSCWNDYQTTNFSFC